MAISRSLHSCLFIIHLINFLGYPRNLIQVSLLSHTLIFLELNSSALRTTPELNLSSIFLLKNLENFGDNLTEKMATTTDACFFTMEVKQNPILDNSEGKGNNINKTQSTRTNSLTRRRSLHNVTVQSRSGIFERSQSQISIKD